MQISQRKLIDKVLRKFNIPDCKYSDIPIEPKLHIEPNATCREDFLIRSSSVVDAFVDADFTNDRQDRKRVTGFFIRVFGNNVIWK
ncbi:hypothetical protein PR048_002246, partial [Dryococelus australis]